MFECITYEPNFVKEHKAAFSTLWSELAWERRGLTPRREYYCNTVPVPYVYGTAEFARSYEPQVWHPLIEEIARQAEEHLGTTFEVAFLNGYENSKDQLGWHADDSPEMDDGRPIAIITLGAEREIMFRENTNPTDVKKLVLGSGSICVMAPGMQDTHKHRIPKCGYECGPRISITLRGFVEK